MYVHPVLLEILNLVASFQTELETDTRESAPGMDHAVRVIFQPTTECLPSPRLKLGQRYWILRSLRLTLP